MKYGKNVFLSPDTTLTSGERDDYEQKALLSPLSAISTLEEEEGNVYRERVRRKQNYKQKSSFSLSKSTRWILFFFISLLSAALMILVFLKKFYLSSSSKDASPLISSDPEWQIIQPEYSQLPLQYNGTYTQNPINSTLGFEKILILNLPYRKDKKDELTIMSALQGLNLTFFNAPLSNELKESGLPFRFNVSSAEVAIYRAHLDILQHIISNGWQSVLVLEDDSDWDIEMKYALQQLHQPLATLINSYKPFHQKNNIKNSTFHDPWLSTEWDYINLGPCVEEAFEKGQREKEGLNPEKPPYIMYEDKTMPFKEDFVFIDSMRLIKQYNISLPNKDDLPTNDKIYKRLVTIANLPICTNAYAISRQGAIRLLYLLSREIIGPIDERIANLGRQSLLRSISIVPPIFSQWKTKDAGLINSDKFSDSIESSKEVETEITSTLNHNPSIGKSQCIKNSLRASLKEKFESVPQDWGYIAH